MALHRRVGGARLPAAGAAADGRSRARASGMAHGVGAAALLLLVPPLHGGAVGPRGRRLAAAPARQAGRIGGGARGAFGGDPPLAARQDDPGRCRARPGRARATARSGARRLPARGGCRGSLVRALLLARVRRGVAPRALRRCARGRAGAVVALDRGTLPRPLLRPATDCSGVPAGARRAAGQSCADARPGRTRSWDSRCWRRYCRGACGGEASARRPASWCRCCRSSSPLSLCGSPSPAAGSRAGGRGCS